MACYMLNEPRDICTRSHKKLKIPQYYNGDSIARDTYAYSISFIDFYLQLSTPNVDFTKWFVLFFPGETLLEHLYRYLGYPQSVLL